MARFRFGNKIIDTSKPAEPVPEKKAENKKPAPEKKANPKEAE